MNLSKRPEVTEEDREWAKDIRAELFEEQSPGIELSVAHIRRGGELRGEIRGLGMARDEYEENFDRIAREHVDARIAALEEELTDGNLDNEDRAPVPPGVAGADAVPSVGAGDAAQAAGVGEAGAGAADVVRLGNCPVCGSDAVGERPLSEMRERWATRRREATGQPPESAHDLPEREPSCRSCGFSTSRSDWNALAEMAAKARAWDALRERFLDFDNWSGDYHRHVTDQELAKARQKAGLA